MHIVCALFIMETANHMQGSTHW